MPEDTRPPAPPFNEDGAAERVALAYTVDSQWRNRDERRRDASINDYRIEHERRIA
jgi:nuclear transport factor 2 (NTF2) superfamily protein